jgi:hypothetical protein
MPTSNGQPRRLEACRTQAVRRTPGRQRGVALIMLLMLVVTASAFVMLSALNNRASRETAQRLVTAEALGQARRALIGYAVGYADGVHTPDKGPGRLPCPDLLGGSDQGVAESTGDCRAASDRETGLLPYRTLGLTTLADGSGAPLWYAVSENFRSMVTTPVNSDAAGAFSVDGIDDVAAVIIAPGAALSGQARGSANAYTAGAWLEGDNATLGDNRYTRLASAANNDTVMVITRGELMAEVTKVVAREVGLALGNYYNDPDGDDDAVSGADPECAPTDPACDNAMPWLAPRTSGFNVAVVGEGRSALARLPLMQLNKDFDASFSALWSLDGTGSVQFTGSEPPSETCLRHNFCTQMINDKPVSGPPTPTPVTFPAPLLGTAAPPWAQGRCVLGRDKNAAYALNLSCTTQYAYSVPGRSLRRVWQLDLGGNTRVLPPGAGARRSVEVRALGSWPAGTLGRVTVADYEGSTLLGAGRLEFTNFVGGNLLVLTGVPFDLELWTATPVVDRHLSPGALPPWLFADLWLDTVLVRYAASEAPGYSGPSCQAAGNCLRLTVTRAGETTSSTVNDLRGVVVTAGPPLPAVASPATPAQVRPSADLKDYLEGVNKIDGNTYERRDASSTFNDQVLPLAP